MLGKYFSFFFSHILSLKVLLVGCNLVNQMLGLLLTQLLRRPFVTDGLFLSPPRKALVRTLEGSWQ